MQGCLSCSRTALPVERRVLVIDAQPSAALKSHSLNFVQVHMIRTLSLVHTESMGHKIEDAGMPIVQPHSLAS